MTSLHLLTSTIILQLVYAQVGTITQDIIALSAFPFQKPCAQSCFVVTGYCPYDVLGSKIGCKSQTNCADSNWQATNDCYCRTDLQAPAQVYLTSCVERYCTVGDSRIDASTAGSIYADYCAQKGYSLAAPATVQATTTAGAGVKTGTGTAAGGAATPTNTSASDSQTSSSSSGQLSLTTIIGIVIGSVIGLAFLVFALKIVFRWFACGVGGRKPHQPQPVYPVNLYPEPYYPHKTDSEVTPDDSISMVSGLPRPAPTLVSNMHSYSPHRY